MSEGFPYADIVILALIAGFILLRLRSILGDKSDDDNSGYFNKFTQQAATPEPIVQLDEKSTRPKSRDEADPYLAALEDKDVASNLDTIKGRDPQFSATAFLDGAKFAFEMVFDAFAKGDRQTLTMLLSPAILKHFTQELEDREKEGSKSETTLVSVKATGITHAALEKNTARLTVHFSSEQVMVVRGDKGEIVEGDPSELHHVEDEWTFERDITSKNPNWQIVET